MIDIKRCSRCRREKLLTEFDKNISSRDGRSCWCKKCMKEYYIEHSEEIKKNNKKWRENREGKRNICISSNNKKRSKTSKEFIKKSKDFIELRRVMGIGV